MWHEISCELQPRTCSQCYKKTVQEAGAQVNLEPELVDLWQLRQMPLGLRAAGATVTRHDTG